MLAAVRDAIIAVPTSNSLLVVLRLRCRWDQARKTVVVLDVSSNKLGTGSSAKALQSVLALYDSMTVLNVSDNALGAAGVKHIASALPKCL